MGHDAEWANDKDIGTNQPPVAGANGRANEEASQSDEAVASPNQATTTESSVDVEQMGKDLAEMKERLLRNVAEMDNMRKRLEREKADFIKFSLESVLKDMIPVLDSFDKALFGVSSHSESGDPKSFHDGMTMVHKQLLNALAKHGLEPVESVGKPFDPNLHQAIQRIESSDVSDEVVATEFMKGYALHGRLIRPAMVSVKVPGGSS
jgi:molecular chaperone GrpE